MVGKIGRVAAVSLGVLAFALAAAPLRAQRDFLQDGLRAAAHPLADSAATSRAFASATRAARVIGLGEATHGQHEAFELKRRLTMTLVRHHGVRVVAYEASASRARAIDDWIHGAGDANTPPMGGFGMLIWGVEENAELLRDLRAWNVSATPPDRVRFFGVDAQDGGAVAGRLRQLLGDAHASVADRVDALVARAEAATQQLFGGRRAAFDSLQADAGGVRRDILRIARRHPQRAELAVRAAELGAHLGMYGTPGGRDRAMADLLLAQLRPRERAVLWAHNAHVQRGPLAYLGSTDLAMGGHLAAALGRGYYALGFTFGSGAFQANAPDSSGRWGFRRYTHAAPAKGSLEETLAAAGVGDFLLDLRALKADSPLQRWMGEPHGHRWWGGYNVPDDADERTRDGAQLMPMMPAREFDGLVFHARTTAAVPVDRSRILPPRP